MKNVLVWSHGWPNQFVFNYVEYLIYGISRPRCRIATFMASPPTRGPILKIYMRGPVRGRAAPCKMESFLFVGTAVVYCLTNDLSISTRPEEAQIRMCPHLQMVYLIYKCSLMAVLPVIRRLYKSLVKRQRIDAVVSLSFLSPFRRFCQRANGLDKRSASPCARVKLCAFGPRDQYLNNTSCQKQR